MTINNAYAVPSWIGTTPYNADSLGLQASEVWLAGESDERQLLDAVLCPAGEWRVSVVGDVTLAAYWGSKGNKRIVSMDAPMMASFPGQVTITAKPRTGAGATAIATISPACTGYRTDFRRFVVHPGGAPIPLEPIWAFYQALTASVLTVRGTAVNVPALARFPLITGTSLDSGAGYLEFTP